MSGNLGTGNPVDLPEHVSPLRDDDPAVLGRYRLLGRLGAGGMGTVFLAEDSAGRRVAAKTIHRHPNPEAHADLMKRFAREVETARRVQSTFTPALLDADPGAEVPYLVMEFVEGPTLAGDLARRGPLARSELHQLAVNLASAIHAFHQAGIVHRDIKADNVILSRTGPRVIDLGIARVTDESLADLTIAGSAQPGTPLLMAPEQWSNQRPTSATDVWAWGVVVAQAGTGRYPFGRGSYREVRLAVEYGDPDLAGLDPAVGRLVAWALAKAQAARPEAAALLRELLGTGSPAGNWPLPASPSYPGPGSPARGWPPISQFPPAPQFPAAPQFPTVPHSPVPSAAAPLSPVPLSPVPLSPLPRGGPAAGPVPWRGRTPVGKRIAARVVDTVVCSVLTGALFFALIILGMPIFLTVDEESTAYGIAAVTALVLAFLLAFVGLEWLLLARRFGQTLGMSLAGVRVVAARPGTGRLGGKDALARAMGYVLGTVVCFPVGLMANLALALVSETGATLHDRIARTIVVPASRNDRPDAARW